MAYRGEPFQQLDGQAWQRRVMFVINIFGQDGNEIVAMATVLCQSLLQRGHNIGGRLQADDVVRDREGQFDCLDQDLSRTLSASTSNGKQQNTKVENTITRCLKDKRFSADKHVSLKCLKLLLVPFNVVSPAGVGSQHHVNGVDPNSHDIDHCLASLCVCQAVDTQRLQGGCAASRKEGILN